MKRSAFLKNGTLALLATGTTPLGLLRAASRSPSPRGTLICIFQRGAMDGIAAVQPLADPNLQRLRPSLTLAAGKGSDELTALDDRFGLHPSLASLSRLYREGRLNVVHGVGLPNATRSHFDAQDYMETGTPGRKSTPDGWLNRVVGKLPGEDTPLRAVSMTPVLPRALYGDHYAVAVERLEDLQVRELGGNGVKELGGSGFEALYRQTSRELLRDAGSKGLDAAGLLSSAELEKYRPAPGARYPESALGLALRQIAQLIKAGVGLEVAFAESAGWDTHARQGGRFGRFTRQARDLAACITAFWVDLGVHQEDVTLMTMTEFGRTVHQNGSGGTDHGRGSCGFVIDNGLGSGKILGSVPELLPANLEDGRDLPVTTDFRSYFAAVAGHRLGITDTKSLFPGWEGEAMAGLW